MSPVVYGDLELAQNIQEFQLKIAGFLIKIRFLPAEQVWFKRLLIDDFLKLWRAFLVKGKLVASVVVLVDFTAMEAVSEDASGDKYYSGLKWEPGSKTIVLKGLQNAWVLQSAFRHILLQLIRGKGFVFHGSAVGDPNKGTVHIFSARSGGGKSTTAGELGKAGWKILTDDTVAFLKTKSGWQCQSLGMVEKQFLPTKFESDDYRIYFVEKAKKLRKLSLKKDANLLEQIIKQVWMLDQTLDANTYKMVTDFAREAKIYKLQLPLRPKGLMELINES